jgi:hypothetical protein
MSKTLVLIMAALAVAVCLGIGSSAHRVAADQQPVVAKRAV